MKLFRMKIFRDKKVKYAIIILLFLFNFLIGKIIFARYYEPKEVDTSSNYELCGGGDTGGGSGYDAGDILEFEFPAGFDLTNLTVSDTDAASEINFYHNTENCTGGTLRVTEATETADNDRDYAYIIGQKVYIKLEDTVGGAADWSFKLIDKTDANSYAVITPSTADNYSLIYRRIDINTGVYEWVEAVLIYVGGLNKVNISADVDPSLTLTLSGNTCDMGTFSATTIKTCNFYTQVDTNASSGYTVYVKEDGDLRNAVNSLTDVADNEVTATYEEYGIATSDSDYASLEIDQYVEASNCAVLNGGSAAPAVALITSDQSYATASGPVDNDEVSLCVSAAISGDTPAGAYSNSIIVTAVGNF